MKYIPLFTLLLMFVLLTACVQNQTNVPGDDIKANRGKYAEGTVDSVKAKVVIKPEPNGPTKAGLAKAIGDGTIYNSTSPYHNVSHEFTYFVAMRDYCKKTLLQMRANGESDSYRMNTKLSTKLERELSKAEAEVASAKFNGLKIESGMYEVFLKNFNDKFSD